MDRRDQPAPEFILYTSDGEMELPTKWGVCSVCDGEGKHVNPNIDRHGLTMNDECWDDPDFADDYWGGVYDVTCYRCNGRTTERVLDWDALTPEQQDAWEHQCEEEYYSRMESEAERRMGA